MSLPSNLLDPIEGPNPAGANLRYEPIYDEIKRARTEEDDVPQGEWRRERKTADYAQVIKLATDVLATKSKDLQIAAWLTEALLRREGFGGLREGLDLMRGMLEQFWEHAYPEIEEDDLELRASPLEWVGRYLDTAVRLVPLNRAGHGVIAYKESRQVVTEEEAEDDYDKREARQAAIEEGKLTPEEFDAEFEATPKSFYKQLVADLDGSLDSLGALDKFGDEKFGEDAPSYHTLRDALQEVRQVAGQLLARKLEADPDPVEIEVPDGAGIVEEGAETAPDSAAAPAVAADPGGGVPGGGGGLAPTPRNRDDAANRIIVAARFMRRERPTDPAPYLLLRGFRWGEIRVNGRSIDPKLLIAPPTDVRTRLKTLLLDEKWAELLDVSEEVMGTAYGRGWLDLQRYALAAADRLGEPYEPVGAALRGALRSLLQDLPELPDLTLMDDSPTANAETRAWLRAEGLLGGDGAVDGADAAVDFGRGAVGEETSPRDRIFERAMERVRAGQASKGIELLMREAAQERSARARFLRRSQAARIMVENGLENVAMPLLQELMQQIERHSLEEWEAGETVAEPMGLLYRCLLRIEGQSSESEELYLRVCRLDPMRAIEFTSAATSNDDESGG